jgi:hypothetical protein
MRILIGFILAICLGGILAAAYTIHPATLSSAELTQVKSTCSDCHKVPVIQSASSIHAAHRFVECSTCHPATTSRVDFNSCIPCHSIPAYTSAAAVHDNHSTTDCVTCHGTNSGVTVAGNANDALKWAGIGLAGFGIFGIIVNYGVVRIRLRHKEDKDGK